MLALHLLRRRRPPLLRRPSGTRSPARSRARPTCSAATRSTSSRQRCRQRLRGLMKVRGPRRGPSLEGRPRRRSERKVVSGSSEEAAAAAPASVPFSAGPAPLWLGLPWRPESTTPATRRRSEHCRGSFLRPRSRGRRRKQAIRGSPHRCRSWPLRRPSPAELSPLCSRRSSSSK